MPNNQFFNDWVTGEVITAEKLNRMKNDVQPYLGYVPVSVDQGGDVSTRYYFLGRIFSNEGFVKVRGILGGHEVAQGRGNIDLQFSFRGGFRADGYAMGAIGGSDILVVDPGDGWAYIYLVTKAYSLVSLELSRQGSGEIYYSGSYNNSAPGGNVLYQLSGDFANNTHPNVLKLNDGVLQTRYDHRDRFTVDAFLGGGSSRLLNSYERFSIRAIVAKIPAGKGLYLKRVRVFQGSGVFAEITTPYATYVTPSNYGDFDLDIRMSDFSSFDNNLGISFYIYNANSFERTVYTWQGHTAEFEIR